MNKFLVLLAGLLLATSAYGIETIKDAATCTAKGGEWKLVNRAPVGHEICVIHTKDSGKVCSDKSECEGGCYYTPVKPSLSQYELPDECNEGLPKKGKCGETNVFAGGIYLVKGMCHGPVVFR